METVTGRRHYYTLFAKKIYFIANEITGYAVTQLVKALRCKPEGRGVLFPMGSGVTGIFHRFNSSGRNMVISTKPLTEISTPNKPKGVGVKSNQCIGLRTLSPSCSHCHEIWGPHPPAALRAYPNI